MLLVGLWLWARRILWFKMDLIRWWCWHFSVFFFDISAIWWIFIRWVERTHANYRWAMKKITWLKEFPETSTLSWTSSLVMVMVGFVISNRNGTSSFQLQSQWNPSGVKYYSLARTKKSTFWSRTKDGKFQATGGVEGLGIPPPPMVVIGIREGITPSKCPKNSGLGIIVTCSYMNT